MFYAAKIALRKDETTLLKVRTYNSEKKNIIADFYVDGKLIGKTPLKLLSSETTIGKHTIMLKAKGYDTIKEDVDFIEGETQILSLRLLKVINPAKKKMIAKNGSNNLNNDKAWYQDWKVQTGIAATIVVTVVAIVLLSKD